jgi:imidazolonepropionase-like amidohydrolase
VLTLLAGLFTGRVGSAPAQEPGVVAIKAGRLVDVERVEVRRDQVIIIRGERIAAVQPGSTRER